MPVDAYTQIPLGIKAPDLSMPAGGGTLGSMLDLQNKQLQQQQTAQSIQTGALEQQRVGTQLGQEQQNLAERNAASAVLRRIPTDYMDPDTKEIAWNRLNQDVFKVAPQVGPAMLQQIYNTTQMAAQAHLETSKLEGARRGYVADWLYSQQGKPYDQVMSGLDALAQSSPDLAHTVAFGRNLVTSGWMGAGQKGMDDAITRLGEGVRGAPEQQTMETPTTESRSSGQETASFNLKPGVRGMPRGSMVPGSVTPQLPGPSTPTVDQGTGQPSTVGYRPDWSVFGGAGAQPQPGTQQPPVPPPAAPQTVAAPGSNLPPPRRAAMGQVPTGMVPGVSGALDTAGQHASAVRASADAAPLTRAQNDAILREIDKTHTGPASSWFGQVAAAAGQPQGTSYQVLGKLLEQKAINAMSSMGVASDARLSAAAAANGTPEYNNDALRDVTKFTDASNTALMKYRQGLDARAGTGLLQRNGEVDPYRREWANNFDLDAFRLDDAVRRGDKQEQKRILSEVAQKPNGLALLKQHRINLESLSKTGRLPQQ